MMNYPTIRSEKVSKTLLTTNILMAFIYISWWFNFRHIDNLILYCLLLFGEIYHLVTALFFWITLWPKKRRPRLKEFAEALNVDIFITVAGEPVNVVRETAIAAKNLNYSKKQIYILNDGLVAKKDNWREIEKLANELGINCITRKTPGGAKAGNINNAIRLTQGEIVCIFDADMVAHPDFLQKVLPYFENAQTGFVQTPQYYKNHLLNKVTSGAWDQQELFFGPIMQGKNNYNSAFICGTNVAIRRQALVEAGGMNEKNIAEDFLTSLTIHQRKWNSYYVKDVLVEGLAPEDLLSYYKQQLRWARGSLEVLFGENPLFKAGLTISQKLQYLASALYYFNGVIVAIDILTPIAFFLFGLRPVSASTTSFAVFFIPYMFLSLYTLYLASDRSISFRALAFSQSSFMLQLRALKSVLTKEKMGFSVTPKKAQQGNFLFLAYPHLGYIFLAVISIGIGVHREGLDPAVITNLAWVIFNIVMFMPFIRASLNSTFILNPVSSMKSI